MRTIKEVINMNTFNRNIFLLKYGKKLGVIDLDTEQVLQYEYLGHIFKMFYDTDTNDFIKGICKSPKGEIIRFE